MQRSVSEVAAVAPQEHGLAISHEPHVSKAGIHLELVRDQRGHCYLFGFVFGFSAMDEVPEIGIAGVVDLVHPLDVDALIQHQLRQCPVDCRAS